MREAQTVARVEHPAIVPVHDFSEHEGQLYLVMRYMGGGSLAEMIERGALGYEILGFLAAGQSALTHWTDLEGKWWWIQSPDGSRMCWISDLLFVSGRSARTPDPHS